MADSSANNVSVEKVNCDACPILCRISAGKTGSCDRYGNIDGKLKRMDPVILTQKAIAQQQPLVPFGEQAQQWDGSLLAQDVTLNPEEIFPLQLEPELHIRIINLRLLSLPANIMKWIW